MKQGWYKGLIIAFFVAKGAFAEPVPAFQLEDSAFRDAWHAILDTAEIQVNYIKVTKAGVRDMFILGEVILDCCTIPEWRTRPEELELQLFSDPFFFIFDHIIVSETANYNIQDVNNLADFKVAVVRGYSFIGDLHFGERIDTDTLAEAFDLVAQGAADMTIANNQEFYLLQRAQPRALKLGPVHGKHALRARVHQSRADLLPRINAAIAELKRGGKFQILMAERLRSIQNE